MSKELIWSFLVHLGECMWRDYGPGDFGQCIKTQPLSFHEPTWRDISGMLKEKYCCNTILIDIGEGVEYESHPEIKAPGSWSKIKLADEISRLRSMGFKVYPKLNFSAAHDKWMGIYSRMVSTPQYYKFCKDIIDEVCELFSNPELFHLGLDEECYSVQTKFPICIIRSGDLLWHDINYLLGITQKNGARPWVWADYVWHDSQTQKQFIENMSRDVLCSNWYYGDWTHTTDFLGRSIKGYQVLEEAGFEQLPAGSNDIRNVDFYCRDNIKLTVENCTKIIAPERLKGFMMTTWELTTEEKKPRLIEATEAMKDAYDFYYSK